MIGAVTDATKMAIWGTGSIESFLSYGINDVKKRQKQIGTPKLNI